MSEIRYYSPTTENGYYDTSAMTEESPLHTADHSTLYCRKADIDPILEAKDREIAELKASMKSVVTNRHMILAVAEMYARLNPQWESGTLGYFKHVVIEPLNKLAGEEQ